MSQPADISLQTAYRQHERNWRENAYVYPVVSRRSGGLSVGINLNPDKVCNLDCIYCQVDSTTPPAVRKVDLDRLRAELDDMLDRAADGSHFAEAPFDCLPPEQRIVRDIAFSGDGEPTTYPRFDEAVQIAAEARRARCRVEASLTESTAAGARTQPRAAVPHDARGLDDTKIVLITDACYLTRPKVRAGLRIMDENNGEIWAKLDAGTEEYYQLVNRPNYPLSHVLANIVDAARARPIVIQSLWMKVHGEPPPEAEVRAFSERINEMIAAGGRFKLIQVYTIARRTTEAFATALGGAELDRIAASIKGQVGVTVERYYGVAD